jgi:hypothetical protein
MQILIAVFLAESFFKPGLLILSTARYFIILCPIMHISRLKNHSLWIRLRLPGEGFVCHILLGFLIYFIQSSSYPKHSCSGGFPTSGLFMLFGPAGIHGKAGNSTLAVRLFLLCNFHNRQQYSPCHVAKLSMGWSKSRG